MRRTFKLVIGNVGIPIINGENCTNTSILFSISPQMNDDFPAVAYNVSVFDSNGDRVFKNFTAQRSIWVHELLAIQNYTVQVYAYNNFKVSSKLAQMVISTKGIP